MPECEYWRLLHFLFIYGIWVCLHAFYVSFLTYFLSTILRFHMRYLQSRLGFPLKLIWNPFLVHPLHLSSLIDTWNEACMGSFCSYLLCSVLPSSLFLVPRPWCASVFSSLPERVGNCRRCILNLWVWRVATCLSSCGNDKNRSWIW